MSEADFIWKNKVNDKAVTQGCQVNIDQISMDVKFESEWGSHFSLTKIEFSMQLAHLESLSGTSLINL